MLNLFKTEEDNKNELIKKISIIIKLTLITKMIPKMNQKIKSISKI